MRVEHVVPFGQLCSTGAVESCSGCGCTVAALFVCERSRETVADHRGYRGARRPTRGRRSRLPAAARLLYRFSASRTAKSIFPPEPGSGKSRDRDGANTSGDGRGREQAAEQTILSTDDASMVIAADTVAGGRRVPSDRPDIHAAWRLLVGRRG